MPMSGRPCKGYFCFFHRESSAAPLAPARDRRMLWIIFRVNFRAPAAARARRATILRWCEVNDLTSFLEFFEEVLAQLGHFGGDHGQAVRLVGIAGKVL